MKMEKKFIIIPGCCDLNRGDQALGWETARIANDAGFIGKYSILSERGEPIEQSIKEGYEVLVPVLEHPSRKSENKDNIIYSNNKKIRWGIVALKDLIISLLLLKRNIRKKVLKKSKNEELKKTLTRFEESKAVFMKGGGLIQSHGGIISTYATYYRLYHIFLAQSMNKPVYVMPNSFGPFEGPFVKYMVKKALRNCKIITAREKKSQEAVKKELNLDIPCFPDLAFYLPNGDFNKEQLCKECGIDHIKKIVAITMRPYRFPNSENPEKSYETFRKEMRKFILWLSKNGFTPLIIEHTFAITSHESDKSCIDLVVKDLNHKDYKIYSNRRINCKDLKSLYGCCDYIIGTRFHSLIFSLSNYVPGIAISYDGYKSVGIMKDMKLENYVIDIADVRASNLIEKFRSLIENEDRIKENIAEYMEIARNKREQLIKIMKGE